MLFRSLPAVVLVAATLPALLTLPTFGQSSPNSASSESHREAQPQGYSLIHVNAVSGSDTAGDGSQFRPFQTISYALNVAEPNSIILLAPGEYTAETGEAFPLVLRPGVTVQGAVAPEVGDIVVRGNGTFVAANGTYMQVTIVGVDGSGLGHITITNPHSSGYGLVIEAGSPVIRSNHFIGSGYGGAYVGGTAAPLFEENLFSENGSVGLVLVGQSRAEVQNNIFENTGTGIQVGPGAEPHIAHNRIVSNRQGLWLAASAQPLLQNNEIARNRQNGLIEFIAANKNEPSAGSAVTMAPGPLLGTQDLPAATLVAAASTSPQPFNTHTGTISLPSPSLPSPPSLPESPQHLVLPNQESLDPIVTEPILSTPPGVLSLQVSSPGDIGASVFSAAPISPASQATDPLVLTSPEHSRAPNQADATSDSEASPATPTQPSISGDNGQSIQAVSIDVDPEEPSAAALEESLETDEASPGSADGENSSNYSIPLQVIPPTVDGLARRSDEVMPREIPTDAEAVSTSDDGQRRVTDLPILFEVDDNAERLRVPEGPIPTGSGSQHIPVLTASMANTGTSGNEPPPPPSRATMLGLVYRVVVPGTDPETQNTVRALVPDAFRVEVENQMMMQVGAYSTEAEAGAIAEALGEKGLEPEVIYIP